MKLSRSAIRGSYRFTKGIKNNLSNRALDKNLHNNVSVDTPSPRISNSSLSIPKNTGNSSSTSHSFSSRKTIIPSINLERNNSKIRTNSSLVNTSKGGNPSGAIPKHGEVDRRTKETTNRHRINKHDYSHRNPINRDSTRKGGKRH